MVNLVRRVSWSRVKERPFRTPPPLDQRVRNGSAMSRAGVRRRVRSVHGAPAVWLGCRQVATRSRVRTARSMPRPGRRFQEAKAAAGPSSTSPDHCSSAPEAQPPPPPSRELVRRVVVGGREARGVVERADGGLVPELRPAIDRLALGRLHAWRARRILLAGSPCWERCEDDCGWTIAGACPVRRRS